MTLKEFLKVCFFCFACVSVKSKACTTNETLSERFQQHYDQSAVLSLKPYTTKRASLYMLHTLLRPLGVVILLVLGVHPVRN